MALPRDEAIYEVRRELKQHLTFARLNLARPPFPMRGPFDAVLCRNVMIYFDAPIRQGVATQMERLVRPGGLVFVGHAETLSGLDTGLQVVGLCAAVLWQVVGRFLVYYFATLSGVNGIYGSLAAVVAMLLFMEIAFAILLLGAQVIAELQYSAIAGVPWWQKPDARSFRGQGATPASARNIGTGSGRSPSCPTVASSSTKPRPW